MKVAFVGAVVLLGLTACDAADRRDAETVVAAVTRFRTADNANTPAAVEALRTTECHAPDACHARDLCVTAGEATTRALKLKAEVERSLAALEKGQLDKASDEAKSLPQKLDDAEKALQQGHDGLPACDGEVQALKRKHRI